jgi:peptidoglycan/xylan/chitin deacetylase (PgdA/CDA1 family)
MNKMFVITILLGANISLFSQTGKICNWQDDKQAAVVLTFDDWSPGQYPIVVPELKKRNINATFFPIISSIADWNHPWSTILEAVSYGNEIGNHSNTHPDLTTKTAAELSVEIRASQSTINSHVSSQKVVSFAYPMGAYNNSVIDSLIKSGHIAARTVFPPSGKYYTYSFATTAKEYFELRTYGMNGNVSTVMFYNQIKATIAGGGLLTYMYHSVDTKSGTYNDSWYAKVIKDSLQKQLDTLVSVKNKVWITTMDDAIKYHREKRCATLLQIQAPENGKWTLSLSDTLSNNSLYNFPLTIKLKTNGVNYDKISQNNQPVKIESYTNDTIMFRAVPDGGPIVLEEKSSTTNISESVLTPMIKIYPNPNDGNFHISVKSQDDLRGIQIISATGTSIYQNNDPNELKGQNPKWSFAFNELPKGLYFVNVFTEIGLAVSSKMLVK